MSQPLVAHRPRQALATLAVLLVVSLSAALLAVGPAQAGDGGFKGVEAKSADKPWFGYPTRVKGSVTRGFLGARQVGDSIVYRIDPGAKASIAAGFQPSAYVETLVGTGKQTVTTLDTQRAAWIVSKYGAYRLKIQTAAVELALDDLLVGGRYRLSGSQTDQRLAHLPAIKQKRIRSFAKQMLAGAAAYASPYAVTMTSTPSVSIGEPVNVSLRVVANGAGVAKLPVVFTVPGASAASPVPTDANGIATTTFTPTAAGPLTIKASVGNVPESRLVVLTPTTKKASRVVVAGVKTTVAATAVTAVRTTPTTSIARSFSTVSSPYQTTGQTFALADSYPSARNATATLFGPYSTDALADCTGGTAKVVGRGTVAVTTSSDAYKLPTLTLPAKGFYRWLITVPADAYNNAPAPLCGGVMVRNDQ